MDDVERYLERNADRFVEELKAFLRIPSVSGDPAHRGDVRHAAEFVRDRLSEAGCSVELVETPGHPIVVGRSPKVDGAPTALVYGHYDVQPATPYELWETPPFEPSVRGGKIYARGATDDKGQLYTHLKSCEAWTRAAGGPPMNLVFVIEGEEEVGSDHLDRFLEDRRADLACDVAVISDTSQYGPGMPAVTYGLRGIVACEVTIAGPNRDLHSGTFGGAVANPVNVLCELVGSLHDATGRVAVLDFYDGVEPLSDDERARIAALPFDEAEFFRELGVEAGHGEAGFTTNERRWARPTLDVNGIFGGHTGVGPKTIIPSQATAKITCRLVPNQIPEKVIEAVRRHFEQRLPAGVEMTFTAHHGAPGIAFAAESPHMAAARAAVRHAFGAEPVLIREGGSIPVVESLRRLLGVETLLLGWGQNTDNLHAPNEHFTLADFHRGIRASARLWAELAKG